MSSKVTTDESGDWFVEFLRRASKQGPLDLNARIEQMLRILTQEEESILRKRLGLGDAKPHTSEELAHELNLSPQEIQEIERRALLKLKHPAHSGLLRSFSAEESTEVQN